GLELRARTADQQGTRIKRSERKLGLGLTGGGDVVRDCGAGKGPGSGSKLGEPPGLGAKLLHGLRWSGKQRGDVAVAAQILCAAELCGRVARVWRRRLRGGDGSPGV